MEVIPIHRCLQELLHYIVSCVSLDGLETSCSAKIRFFLSRFLLWESDTFECQVNHMLQVIKIF